MGDISEGVAGRHTLARQKNIQKFFFHSLIRIRKISESTISCPLTVGATVRGLGG
jgi:hypothetical protein